MPIANGRMYPELNIHPQENRTLRVMLLDADEAYIYLLMNCLEPLRQYIEDIGASIQIEVWATKSEALYKNKTRYKYSLFDSLGQDSQAIIAFAYENNVDLIYSSNEKLISTLYGLGKPFQYADSKLQLENEIEAFLTGKDIPWLLSQPVWNATWLSKYIEELPLVGNLRQLRDIASLQLKYTPSQVNYVRALLNKALHIRHSEEMLLAFVQRKNYAERNYTKKNSYNYDEFYDYSFELNYHLGNYYFLISGSLDIIGRLLADLYSITDKDVKPNIEHSNFQEQLKSRNKSLYDFYTEAENNAWMIWLKRKRNYVAHEAETSYSNVIKAKKTKISNEAVDKKVNAMQKWNSLKILAGDAYVESQKAAARFVVRMHEDNRILTKDAMELRYFDHETKETAGALFHPLVDIKADYGKASKLLNYTAEQLVKATSKS